MRKENVKRFVIALTTLLAFIIWTALVCVVDVQAIGPWGSTVGFAAINSWFHSLTGTHMCLYTITDWLGLVPVAFGFGFALLGLFQWIQRHRIWKVDFSILILGGYYIIVLVAYLLFEEFVVNYRPVLINDYLEASYPSSTTLLVLCVMPTAMLQLKHRIKSRAFRRVVLIAITLFMVFMVIGRLVSGVHWFTDIIGGILLGAALVALYNSIIMCFS